MPRGATGAMTTKKEERIPEPLAQPVYLDIQTGSGDFLGALLPTLRIVLMPDGMMRWLECDITGGPLLRPLAGGPVVASDSEPTGT